jgi:hypothetical protein
MLGTQPPAPPLQSPARINLSKNLRRWTSTFRDRRAGAVEEINAYIAVRDSLLAQAEKVPTLEANRSVAVANDVVQTCLRPARRVYAAQHLPEADAVRELRRCQDVTKRIIALRDAIC